MSLSSLYLCQLCLSPTHGQETPRPDGVEEFDTRKAGGRPARPASTAAPATHAPAPYQAAANKGDPLSTDKKPSAPAAAAAAPTATATGPAPAAAKPAAPATAAPAKAASVPAAKEPTAAASVAALKAAVEPDSTVTVALPDGRTVTVHVASNAALAVVEKVQTILEQALLL